MAFLGPFLGPKRAQKWPQTAISGLRFATASIESPVPSALSRLETRRDPRILPDAAVRRSAL